MAAAYSALARSRSSLPEISLAPAFGGGCGSGNLADCEDNRVFRAVAPDSMRTDAEDLHTSHRGAERGRAPGQVPGLPDLRLTPRRPRAAATRRGGGGA